MADVGSKTSKNLFRWADQIPAPLWDDLALRSPKEAADCVGALWCNERFEVSLLGAVYLIDPDQKHISRSDPAGHRVSYQTGIVLLTTLAKSMGAPPSGRMVTPEELQGGRLFFSGAHRPPTQALVKRYGGQPQALVERALQLGGKRIPGADYAVCIPGLPRLPMYILFWEGEEDLQPRAIIGIDDRALFHLDLAGVFGLMNILVSRLVAEA